MFDFLKGGKVNLNVKLERPYYFPGEQLCATITVACEKETKIQEGKAILICREEFEYEYQSTTGEGANRRTTRSTRWATDDKEMGRQVFLKETVLAPGSSQTYQFTANIPTDALPTWLGGKLVKTRWLLKVSLARKMALGWDAETEVGIVIAPSGRYNAAGEFGFSNKPDEVELALKLPSKEFVVGERIDGELVVRPKKDFEANEVKLELVRCERVSNPTNMSGAAQFALEVITDVSERGREYEEKQSVKVAPKTKFQSGQEARIPFHVTIASPRPSTGTTAHSQVAWRLKGSLERGLLHSSYSVDEEIYVYTRRSS